MKRPYVFTLEDWKLIGDLFLELSTELDLHYDDSDMNALASSFAIIKQGVALLERANFDAHPDVRNVLARFNKARQ